MTNLFFEGDAPVCGEDVFKNVPSNCTVWVAAGTKGWDDDGDGLWQGLTVRVMSDDESVESESHEGTAEIDGVTWHYRKTDGGVEIVNDGEAAVDPMEDDVVVPDVINGKPVVRIGDYAFIKASWMTIKIGKNVREISPSAFAYAGQAVDILLNEGNTNFVMRGGVLYDGALTHAYFCNRGVSSVTLPESVRTFSYSVFEDCAFLKSIAFPEGIEDLEGEQMFYGSGLESVTLPQSLRKIGFSVFCWCPNLTQVDLPPGLVDIGDQAFLSCSLRSVDIPDSVTSIGVNAFMGCTNLVEVRFGKGIAGIGIASFMWSTRLSRLTFMGNAPTVGELAFQYVPSNCIVMVEKDSKGWGVDIPGVWNNLRIVQRPSLDEYLLVADDGLGNMSFHYIGNQTVVNIPIIESRVSNKRFAGWACSNGRRYDDGVLVFNLAEPGETVTMTAIWE